MEEYMNEWINMSLCIYHITSGLKLGIKKKKNGSLLQSDSGSPLVGYLYLLMTLKKLGLQFKLRSLKLNCLSIPRQLFGEVDLEWPCRQPPPRYHLHHHHRHHHYHHPPSLRCGDILGYYIGSHVDQIATESRYS